MLVWFALFFIVVMVSFILALRSMGDYQELPPTTSNPYALYLVQKPAGVSVEILNHIHSLALQEGLLVSFERLFRGQRQALVVYGPISLLGPHANILGLVELEDYSQRNQGEFLAWEVGVKNNIQQLPAIKDLLGNLPKLEGTEEFWWQVVAIPAGSGLSKMIKSSLKLAGSEQSGDLGKEYSITIRAVTWADDRKKAQLLQTELLKIGSDVGLTMLPQAYSKEEIVSSYRKRSTTTRELSGIPFAVTALQLCSLIGCEADF